MISKVYTAIPYGYNGQIIEVESTITRGLPNFDIVGMANKTVSEARQRVRSAITSSGLYFPTSHIIISLAPAEIAKTGNFFDIPIAISVLISSKQLLESDVKDCLFVGELSLDGKIKPVRGIISILESGKTHGFKRFFIPKENMGQAAIFNDLNIIGVESITELILILKGQKKPAGSNLFVVKNTKTDTKASYSLNSIRGQELAKRALIIALAGRHNIILSGSPGTGKTLLAHTAISLLPDLSNEEYLEILKIHSLKDVEIPDSRPFRTPHHTTSLLALIGGGNNTLMPGEISLAHNGVLFLDEFPEYPRAILESLRQPLEDKQITITRANARTTYPANFMLIATMNPCPCGYLGDKKHKCTCKDFEIKRYRNKLSGPLMDRIDMQVTMDPTSIKQLSTIINHKNNPNLIQEHLDNSCSNDSVVKNNITEVVNIQHHRYRSNLIYNSSLTPSQISEFIIISKPAQKLLDIAAERLNLSARSYFKVIKVARTIADFDKNESIEEKHITQALTYRFDP